MPRPPFRFIDLPFFPGKIPIRSNHIGDAYGIEGQRQWSAERTRDYLLLNVAAGRGTRANTNRKGGELMERSIRVTERFGLQGNNCRYQDALGRNPSRIGKRFKGT